MTHFVSILYVGHGQTINATFGDYTGPRYSPRCSCGWQGENGTKEEAQ